MKRTARARIYRDIIVPNVKRETKMVYGQVQIRKENAGSVVWCFGRSAVWNAAERRVRSPTTACFPSCSFFVFFQGYKCS
jgi:hypothetical protein